MALLVALQGSYDIIMAVVKIKDDIEVNEKSTTFLAESLQRLLPGINQLMKSDPPRALQQPISDLHKCCIEARDFVEQFTKKQGGVWETVRKAYRRESDCRTIGDLLERISRISQDLNLGVVIDIKDEIRALSDLFKEDTQQFTALLVLLRKTISASSSTRKFPMLFGS
jgi:hypothetical protein